MTFLPAEKPTIILTIIRSMTARNLLQNDFYHILRERFRIIILTPAANDPRFIEEFKHPNVRFEYFDEKSHSRADIFFLGLHKYLIFSKYIALKLRYGIRALTRPEDLSLIRYYVLSALFIPLSKIRFLREAVRLIDYHFFQRREVSEFIKLIEREQPVLVISTSISSNIESALIKAARKKGIPAIGMPKSWDNASRAGWRTKADTLVVWNEFGVEQSRSLQSYRADQVRVVGIPQFDYYADPARKWSREKFCKEFNLDPSKKIILFTSEGKSVPEDADIATVLHEFAANGKLATPCQLLIRPHFSYKDDEQKFVHLFGKKGVAVDRENTPSRGFRDHGDYSKGHMDRFANSLFHAGVVVNVASTITLDAAAFDKPIVNIAFEPQITVPANIQPITSFYESDYFLEIVKTGASKIAYSKEELLSYLNRYLKDPSLENIEREELRRRFCYRVDGGAGKRFAEIVIKESSRRPYAVA